MRIPERWLKYSNSGRIHDTRFIALKVPLRKDFNARLPASECYTPAMVLHEHPKLKLIIDLTFSTKYYNGVKEFEENGVQYRKLKCKGREIPSEIIFQRFVSIVEEFIANNPQDYLIGVHCTHGVNRTGYLIVRYMIERLNYKSDRALQDFFKFRGHEIERTNYIRHLHEISKQRSKLTVRIHGTCCRMVRENLSSN